MTEYAYTCRTAKGEESSGSIRARSAASARARLFDRGFRSVELEEFVQAERIGTTAVLRPDECAILAEQVAHVAASGAPLVEGLRAASTAPTTRRVQAALEALASRVERGDPLDTAVELEHGRLPEHLRTLLIPAIRSGNLVDAISSMLALERDIGAMRAAVRQAATYPLLLCAGIVLMVMGFELYVAGNFQDVFEGFDLELPALTQMMMLMAGDRVIWLGRIVGLVVALGFVARLIIGASGWRRMINALPIVGPMMYWSSVARMMRWLQILTEQHVPLDEALRLTASAASDANLSIVCQRLRSGVIGGRSLSAQVAASGQLPRTMAPILAWGEQRDCLPESLAACGDLMITWAANRSNLFAVLLFPMSMLFIGAFSFLLVLAIFLPLISLVTSLT